MKLKNIKIRTMLLVTIPLFILIILIFGFWCRKPSDNADFEFTAVKRGDIENIISSTGTLEAKGTVEVGTQVSGTIDKVYVDFNDQVKKNQILAVLDSTLLAAAVREAEANLQRAQAEMDLSQTEFDNAQQLYDADYISELDFKSAKTGYEAARASLLSAQASLDRARLNLKYAVIRSPISGTVIDRVVEPGQTVAASLSTPTLFLIAEDLAQMEIHAYVDESDIGQIKQGQDVRFTVEAYPDQEFTGVVREIRLQPEVVQNIVNYTVVINAENQDRLLLPGMTATVDFIIEQCEDVLMIANAALHFEPSDQMLAEIHDNMKKKFASLPDSVKEKMQANRSSAPDSSAQKEISENSGVLWFFGEDNKLSMIRVRTGMTDGKYTELIDNPGDPVIEPGMEFISGSLKAGASETKSTSNQRRPGPPPLF
jgi:HlyD family secretion protein